MSTSCSFVRMWESENGVYTNPRSVPTGILWLAEPPCLFVLDFNHYEALRGHGWPGFRAIPEFEQPIDVRRGEFSSAHVQQRPHHLAHHIAKKGAPADRKNQLFIISSADQLGRVDFALGGSLLVVLFRARRSPKRSEVVRPNKAGRGVSHGVFIERKGIVQNVTPDRRRHDSPAIQTIVIRFAPR